MEMMRKKQKNREDGKKWNIIRSQLLCAYWSTITRSMLTFTINLFCHHRCLIPWCAAGSNEHGQQCCTLAPGSSATKVARAATVNHKAFFLT